MIKKIDKKIERTNNINTKKKLGKGIFNFYISGREEKLEIGAIGGDLSVCSQ